FVALANLVGFEGGKGFPGASAMIDPNGKVLARGPLFEEGVVDTEIDLDALTNARSDSPLLADLQSALPVLTKGLGETKHARKVSFDPASNGAPPKLTKDDFPNIDSTHFGDPDPLAVEPELVRKWLVRFLKDELTVRRGFKKGL